MKVKLFIFTMTSIILACAVGFFISVDSYIKERDRILRDWNKTNIEKAKKDFSPLISAVYDYKKRTGRYPVNIEPLMNDLHITPPHLGAGQFWNYHQCYNDFSISFGLNNKTSPYPNCHYSSMYKKWHIDN